MTTKVDIRPILALEISPLGEREFTGISNVTKALAEQMLADEKIDARFFFFRGEVPRPLVERLVSSASGEILWWLIGNLVSSPVQPQAGQEIIGLFTSTKRQRRLFPVEGHIIHDLTTIVTPQFHSHDAVRFWTECLPGDILSSDFLIAVSEATRADIRTYLPEAEHIPCTVAHLGTSDLPLVSLPTRKHEAEDYVVVLGTLEPRKNIRFIFECLANHKELLSRFRFVFIGRQGWDDDAAQILNAFGLSSYLENGQIMFTGYIADETRNMLLAMARLVIYPSRYEGFGLPIIEALHFGTPVITSYSSSLPEVGGDVAYYCDVSSPVSLYNTILQVVKDEKNGNEERRNARKAWAAQFDWGLTYERIKDAAFVAARQIYGR